MNPKDWADESYRIAKTDAYHIPYKGKPSTQYIKKGQKIIKQRIALAGYRLAYLLNELYGSSNGRQIAKRLSHS